MLRLSVILCFSVSIVCSLLWLLSVEQGQTPQQFQKEYYNSFVAHLDNSSVKIEFDEVGSKDSLFVKVTKQLIDELYKSRVSNYKEVSSDIKSVSQLLLAFIAIGLLIMFYRPDHMTVPVISVSIPDSLPYLFVSAGLLYLWIEFGLNLNAGIDSRLALHHLAEYRETFQGYSVAYQFSDVNTFVDTGILDTWSGAFYELFDNGENTATKRVLAWIGLLLVFGVFWAMIHAVCLILIVELYYKIGKNSLLSLFYGICALFFLISCLTFASEFTHGLGVMAWMWGLAGFAIVLWKRKGVKLADEIERKAAVDIERKAAVEVGK
jgi:hypothetical protein